MCKITAIIIALLMTCLLFASCNKNNIQSIEIDKLEILHTEDLPFGFDQFVQIADGRYVFNKLFGNSNHLYIFDVKEGIVAEQIIEEADISFFYDAERETLLVSASKFSGSQRGEVLICFNEKLEEKWRINMPLPIRSIIVKEDLYYVASNDIDPPYSLQLSETDLQFSCTITAINIYGEVINTYFRENFKFNRSYEDGPDHIICGEMIIENKAETVLMKLDDQSFFSENYLTLHEQESLYQGIIQNQSLTLLGSPRGAKWPGIYEDINLIDLKNWNVYGKIDTSKIRSKYASFLGGAIRLGENSDQYVLVLLPKPNSKYYKKEIGLLLVTIDREGKEQSVHSITWGPYEFMGGFDITVKDGVICFVGMDLGPRGEGKARTIITFDLDMEQLI